MTLTHQEYLDELQTFLKPEDGGESGDWYEYVEKGAEFTFSDGTTGENVDNRSVGSGRWQEHYEVVTALPDGTYVAWDYALGLTEMQDHTPPGEFGNIQFEERVKIEETVVITKYAKP